MKQTNVGRSGLRVGQLGIGTLTWGRDTELDDAQRMVAALLDAGGNLIDISPRYGSGLAQQVLGQILADGINRRELVIVAHTDPMVGGRAGILDSLHELLENLGTSYVDVVQVGGLDPRVPFEETLAALASVVDAGAARYIGLANHPAWRAAQAAQYLRDLHLPHLATLGLDYSLLNRRAERGSLAVADEFGIGIFAQSPLAGGTLTGKYRHTIPPTSRAATEHLAATVDRYLDATSRRLVEAVTKAADGLGRTPVDVSLTWLLSRSGVAAALCGARTSAQFEQLLGANLDALPDPVTEVLCEVTTPTI